VTVLLKTDRLSVEPLHAAVDALDRDVARLERIHRSRRWADPLNQRFERVISEASFAFTSANHRMKLDEDRSASSEQRQYGEIDRGRILAHIERVREAVEALRRDLAPDERPAPAARPKRTTPKPEPQVNRQLVADYSATRRAAALARREEARRE
jgi:hypothetical protein